MWRHRRIIDDLQPYQRGRRAYNDPLAILQVVSNCDKHNDIYVAGAAVEKPAFRLVRLKNGVRHLEDITVEFTGERFRPYANDRWLRVRKHQHGQSRAGL
jgi:hypothetical protein